MTQTAESHTGLGYGQRQGKYVLDVSHRSIIELKGTDGLDLLQRISTNEVAKLETGKSVQTILTNEKGKIVDVIVALKLSETDLMLVGNTTGGEALHAWLDKYIIMEDAAVENKTGNFAHFLLYGNNVDTAVLSNDHTNYYRFVERLGEASLYHILCPVSERDHALARLLDAGYQVTSDNGFTEFRVEKDIPAHPNELSLEYNPMEAGLIELINFTKGCYIGQEVIARLDTYKKVQKRLTRFELGARPEFIPTPILNSKEDVGVITTTGEPNSTGQTIALGYIKTNIESSSPIFFLKGTHSIQIKRKI